MPLLEVKNLHTFFKTRKGLVRAVDGVSFSVEEGKTLAIVGESGSGKSVTAMSVLRLLDEGGYIDSGEILFDDGERILNLATLSQKELYAVRGNRISMIFQEPMTALNPVFTVEKQLSEPFFLHRRATKKEAKAGALSMLTEVGIPSPKRVLKSYAHQLSGGMRQRVMIAMALACRPKLLIADEPTTALDVTVQAQILRLMKDLQAEKGTAILFISHDLALVREMADEVAVTYCGQVVERVPAPVVFNTDGYSHPYTEGLLACAPSGKSTDKRLRVIEGSVPSPFAIPKGCRFSPRCPYRQPRCEAEEASLVEVKAGHFVRCFYAEEKSRRAGEREEKA